MKTFYNSSLCRFVFIFFILLLPASFPSYGQGITYPYFYRVYLKDKGDYNISSFLPEELLSSRAIARRKKTGIEVLDIKDIPLYPDYINKISSSGFKLHCTSRWMNTAVFKTLSKADIKTLLDLPFVLDVKVVKTPGTKSDYNNKLDFQVEQPAIPPYDRAITMVNGQPLHNAGFDGRNILIAVLDGGFLNADKISSLFPLRERIGIKSTYDFVTNSDLVYNSHTHGTAVLSILAGIIPKLIAGTAPGADFLLLKTEDVESESPCEEDFWASGAEYADSAGADIISSSLGYFNFDDPSLNYKKSDLDGKTAFITKVAEVAAAKGILVVNSAGNERSTPWHYIIFPADGENVLAIGAVDGDDLIADFSSAGPSSDKRIKPDNTALGVSISLQTSATSVGRSSGTSFSCPVLSGMAACLLQAVPQALNTDIIGILHSSADRYSSPDSLYGYGIPDMVRALTSLQQKYLKIPDNESFVYPNPTAGDFDVIFRQPPEKILIEIFSMSGKVLFSKEFSGYPGRSLRITELQHHQQGVYYIRLKTASKVTVHKVIKIKS